MPDRPPNDSIYHRVRVQLLLGDRVHIQGFTFAIGPNDEPQYGDRIRYAII